VAPRTVPLRLHPSLCRLTRRRPEATLPARRLTAPGLSSTLWDSQEAFDHWPAVWGRRSRRLAGWTRLGAADKLGIAIFLVTGTPGIAASIGGPDAVSLAAAFLITSKPKHAQRSFTRTSHRGIAPSLAGR
jgi:hypothetical protein